MTVDQMRTALKDAYPGPRWKLRCQDMSDRRVIAIYKSMESRGQLYRHKKKSKRNEPGVIRAVQITMLDIDPTLFYPAG